jgi:hypothetical protein
MDLYIYDRSLNLVGINDSFDSLRWVRRHYKSGEFELHCPLTEYNLSLLSKGNIIHKKGDIEAGFIEYRNMKQESDGKESLVIKGRFLTGYINRRIIGESKIINTTSEMAMREIVNDNCIAPNDNKRIIPNLILGVARGYKRDINYQVQYGANLSEELENISDTSDLGHRINLDINNKRLVFDVYEGLDRSVNQNDNPRCIFSKEFDNIIEQEYTDSLNNYKNLCVIGGTGEGSSRKLATIGDSTGLDRFEVFNDQKGLSNEVDGTVMSDTDYSNLLIGKGNETLANSKEIQTFNSRVNLKSNLKYKIDFDIGDIVTMLSKRWNVTLDSRIIEIEEVYEENGLDINITFGANIPTLIDKIKIMNKQQPTSGGSITTTITDIDGGTFI